MLTRLLKGVNGCCLSIKGSGEPYEVKRKTKVHTYSFYKNAEFELYRQQKHLNEKNS